MDYHLKGEQGGETMQRQELTSRPITPSLGKWKDYFKSDGHWIEEDTGAEYRLLSTSPTGGVLFGRMLFVDDVNGNNSTAVRGNETLPFKTVAAALAVAISGDLVLVLPGTYDLAAGITIPAGVILSGISSRATTLRMLGVTANTTLVTMSDNSLLNNVTLELTTTGAFSLTACLHPSTLAALAFMVNVTITVTKTISADAAAVTGVLFQSPVIGSVVSTNLRNVSISVSSTGTGTNRGILQNMAAGTLNSSELFSSCTGSGSSIGAEVNFAGAVFRINSGKLNGTTADVSRTAGLLEFGVVDLVNANANSKSFDTVRVSSIMVYADDGGLLGASTRFMRIGTGTSSINEIKIRVPRKTILQKMWIRALTGPGGIRTDTFTFRKNGVDTALAASLVGAAVDVSNLADSVGFMKDDDVSLKVVTAAGTGTSDVQIWAEFF